MPQPLKSYSKKLPNGVGLDIRHGCMDRYPSVSVGLASVVAAWAKVELNLGILLAALLDTAHARGVAMFNALTSTSAQRAVLKGAAEVALSGMALEIYDATMLMVDSVQKQRNPIIHGVHATSKHLPEKLLVIDSATALRLTAAMMVGGEDDEERNARRVERRDALLANIMVYSRKQFDALAVEMDECSKALGRLAARIGDPQALQQLYEEPRTRKWLRQRSRKNPPSAEQ